MSVMERKRVISERSFRNARGEYNQGYEFSEVFQLQKTN